MHVQVEEPALLEALAAWLAARGWPVVADGTTEADVLVPWEQDEFAAALKLRADLSAWRAAHGDAEASVDADVWASPRAA